MAPGSSIRRTASSPVASTTILFNLRALRCNRYSALEKDERGWFAIFPCSPAVSETGDADLGSAVKVAPPAVSFAASSDDRPRGKVDFLYCFLKLTFSTPGGGSMPSRTLIMAPPCSGRLRYAITPRSPLVIQEQDFGVSGEVLLVGGVSCR